MKTKLIEIQVHGLTGSGKTHVCAVIEKALKENYGFTIVAAGLEQERRSMPEFFEPSSETIFVIHEMNQGNPLPVKRDVLSDAESDMINAISTFAATFDKTGIHQAHSESMHSKLVAIVRETFNSARLQNKELNSIG